MQEIQFKNLQDDIVYHANIFNYDKKFLTQLLNKGIKINFSDYFAEKNKNKKNANNENNEKKEKEDISFVINFFNSKAKDQVESLTIAVDHEYGKATDDEKKFKETKKDRKAFELLINLFRFCHDKVKEKLGQNNKGNNQIDVGDPTLDNLIACLLFFDGISMVNIDIIKLIENQIPLVDMIFELLNNEGIDFHIKEIASHILSIDLMQKDGSIDNEKENFSKNCKNLINWLYKINSQPKRDSCLTSNLSLLLTIDENIDYFLGKEFNKEYNHLRKIFELMTDADININIIYESLLCLWNISSNKKYFYIFEDKNNKYIEKIVQVIRTNKIDKVARIGLMTLQNLLDSQICVEILFDIKFMQTVSILLTNKWNDPVIRELLNFCLDFLEKNYKSMK